MGRTLFKQALCQWKVDGCLSGLSPFLGFCCFVFFLRFFLRHFSRICFFLGGDVDRILLGLDCVFGVWGWPIFYFFWILMVFWWDFAGVELFFLVVGVGKCLCCFQVFMLFFFLILMLFCWGWICSICFFSVWGWPSLGFVCFFCVCFWCDGFLLGLWPIFNR